MKKKVGGYFSKLDVSMRRICWNHLQVAARGREFSRLNCKTRPLHLELAIITVIPFMYNNVHLPSILRI